MSPIELLYHQSSHSTAYQGPERQLVQFRSPDFPESGFGDQSSNIARNLLQSEQQGQSQQQVASNTLQDVAVAQKNSAADQHSEATSAAAAETRPEGNPQTAILPSSIQQYQPAGMPFVDTDRLISAAVTQASHLMGDTVKTYKGENQFDAWPLVNPPFQEALHEVSLIWSSSKQ